MSQLISKANTSDLLRAAAADAAAPRYVGTRRHVPVMATPAITGVIAGAGAAVTAEATQNTGPESVEELEKQTEKEESKGLHSS